MPLFGGDPGGVQSNKAGFLGMKLIPFCILFFLPPHLTQIVEVSDFYRYWPLFAKVSSSLADRYYSHCSFILYSDDLTDWHQTRQMFLVAKTLSKSDEYQQRVIVTSFKKFTEFYRLREKASRCAQTLFIIFSWTENTRKGLEEMSKEVPMADFLWLVFLRNDETTESFLKDVNTPFDIHMVLGRVQDDNNVELEEAYRVSEGYPLRVSKFGSWNETSFIAPQSPSVYSRRRDLEGFPVRVSSKEDDPISTVEKIDTGEIKVGGYFGFIFYELANTLNFTSTFVDAVENVTGTENDDGTWNGLAGMLIRDEIDVAAGPMTFGLKTLKVVDFIHPLLRTNYQVFFKHEGNVLEWDSILKPFGEFVWLTIISWILVAMLALNFCFRMGSKYGNENAVYHFEFSRMNSFFIFLKALCQQSNSITPDSWPCRALYITGYLTSSVLLTAYSAALIAHLTSVPPNRPFDNLETMLKDGTYRVVAIEKSPDYGYFSEATDDLRSNIYRTMVEKVPDKHILTKEDGVEQVCYKHKYALFITYAVTQITARQFTQEKGCTILHFSQHLDKLFLTPARRKEFPFGQLIEYQVQIMETAGILTRLQKKAWPLEKKTEGVNFLQVNMEEVVQIFTVLFIGIVFSSLVLMCEILQARTKGANAKAQQAEDKSPINRKTQKWAYMQNLQSHPYLSKLMHINLISDDKTQNELRNRRKLFID